MAPHDRPADTGAQDDTPPLSNLGDPDVVIAVGLGWDIADLYAETDIAAVDPAADPPTLPGQTALGLDQLLRLRVEQITAGVHRLNGRLEQSGMDVSVVDRAHRRGDEDPDEDHDGGLAEAAPCDRLPAPRRALHPADRGSCSGGDGIRSRASPCRPLSASARSNKDDFIRDFGGRVETISGWLGDLKSVLPAHSSAAVSLSLEAWATWLATTPDDGRVWSAERPWPDRVHPQRTASDVDWALFNQGERWRAVLTGEKEATDSLTADDLVEAGNALLQRLMVLIVQFLIRYWKIAFAGTALLVVLAVALTIGAGGIAAALGGLAALAGAFGITWRGTRSTLGSALASAEKPLWGAQQDLAVAKAITVLPGSDLQVTLNVPVATWLQTLLPSRDIPVPGLSVGDNAVPDP